MRDLIQKIQKEKCGVFHAACTAEKDTRAKNLLQVKALWIGEAAQKIRIEKLTRRLAVDLSAQERSIAEMRHTEDAVTFKETVTGQVKQKSFCVTALDGEDMNGKEIVAVFNIMLMDAEKRVEDVAYGRVRLQARM